MKDCSLFLQKLSALRKFKPLAIVCLFNILLAPIGFAQDPDIPVVPVAPTDPPPPPAAPPEEIAPLPPKPDFIPPDLVPVARRLDTFFNTLALEGSKKAYTDLLDGSALLGGGGEIVANVIENTDAALEAFGNIDAKERVLIRRTGDRLTSITYIGHTARWPIRWNFVFYYGGGRWQILDIDVSNDLDLMIDRGRDRPKKE